MPTRGSRYAATFRPLSTELHSGRPTHESDQDNDAPHVHSTPAVTSCTQAREEYCLLRVSAATATLMAATRPSHHSRATSPPCTRARAVTNNERRSARWHPRADLAPRPMAPRSRTRLWATHVRGSFGHGDGGDERVELHHVRDHPPVRSVTRAGKGQRGYYSRESNEGTHCRESICGGARRCKEVQGRT